MGMGMQLNLNYHGGAKEGYDQRIRSFTFEGGGGYGQGYKQKE